MLLRKFRGGLMKCLCVIVAIFLSGFASCQRAPDSSARDAHKTPAVKPSEADLDEMRKESETPVDITPPKWEAIYSEGVDLLSQGKYRAAVQKLSESIELSPKFGLAFINRGVAYRDLEDYEQALLDLRKGAELDHITSGYMTMAYEAEILACASPSGNDNTTQAIELAKGACERANWKSFFTIAVLAAAYANAGDFEEAVHWQQEATRVIAEDQAISGPVRSRLTLELAKRTSLYTARQPCRILFPDALQLNRQSDGSIP
jgi:tetratricopeptide (TPR) repeat protein